MSPTVTVIDVPTIAPRERQPLIFGCFDALAVGQALEIVNDHDPQPLHLRFSQSRSGQFSWRYLEAGPLRWHVRIARVADGVAGTTDNDGSCSGAVTQAP